MKVSVGSCFRNGESYIPRYIAQIDALRAAAPEHEFRMIIAEGDSSDQSYELLKQAYNGCVFKREHGGPVFGSVDDPVRFKQSSWVWEGIIERVEPTDDAFLYLEADLIWQPTVMLQLLKHLGRPGVDVVAPFCVRQGVQYDCWGLRGLDGNAFGPYYPYHYAMLNPSVNGLYPISTAGSCLAMKAEVAHRAHFIPADLAVVGLCRNIGSLGYKLWIDPALKVEHP